MITNEQAARLKNTLEEAARAGHRALLAYGPEAQEIMAVEEIGELLTMIARRHCDRGTDTEVVSEAADVIIAVLQIGLMFGAGQDYNPDSLIEAIALKTRRLSDRVSAKLAIGDGS